MGFLGNVWDKVTGTPGDPSKLKLPGYQKDLNTIQSYQNQGSPYQQQSSYTQDWRSLINQLQNGNPAGSVAAGQYRQTLQDTGAQASAMSRGSVRPGAGRAAMNMQAQNAQGLAAGSAQAFAQEAAQNQAQLGSAIQGATQAEAQVNRANQDAWMQMMAQRLGLNQAQFQAILAQEQMKMQQGSPLDKLLKMGAQGAMMYAQTQTGGMAGPAVAAASPK